jgi:hypothetical protein
MRLLSHQIRNASQGLESLHDALHFLQPPQKASASGDSITCMSASTWCARQEEAARSSESRVPCLELARRDGTATTVDTEDRRASSNTSSGYVYAATLARYSLRAAAAVLLVLGFQWTQNRETSALLGKSSE